MEGQILEELVQIKWIMLAIFIAFLLFILYTATASALQIKRSNTKALLMIRDELAAELSLLDSQGQYDELLSKAEDMKNMFPNDLLANWYLAIGSEKKKQYGAALSALGKIKEVSPTWSSEAVDAMIENIREKMPGPRAN